MRRKTALVGAAISALVMGGLSAGAARASVSPQNHAFVASTAGYIGCFEIVGGSPGACLEAVSQSDGLHLSYFNGLSIEETVDPHGSITTNPTASGLQEVTIDASLPQSGAVHILSSEGQPASGVGCEFCWSPTYHIESDTPTSSGTLTPLTTPIMFGTYDNGTIGAAQITSRGHWYQRTNSHWIGGPVSGYYVGPSVSVYIG